MENIANSLKLSINYHVSLNAEQTVIIHFSNKYKQNTHLNICVNGHTKKKKEIKSSV